ncbi:MAG: hypothetical protein JNK73_10710 [Bacteroidia bacterium]|nr:hypothetical protein [Bacteroidia bacterium]
MNLTNAKASLAKRILNTESKEIIGYITAIFESQPNNWFEELPESVKVSVAKGLKQSRMGEGRPHSEVMQKHKKWLNK